MQARELAASDAALQQEAPGCGGSSSRAGRPATYACPAKTTIHAVLDRHGLVKRMGKRRIRATGTPLSKALALKDLSCADFKGEIEPGNGRYGYPLTVTDQA